MIIELLRHATIVISLGQVRLLVDPMLSPARAMDPLQGAPNPQRIPLVDLPIDAEALVHLIQQVDGVLVTHTHRDHWDAQARGTLAVGGGSLALLVLTSSDSLVQSVDAIDPALARSQASRRSFTTAGSSDCPIIAAMSARCR